MENVSFPQRVRVICWAMGPGVPAFSRDQEIRRSKDLEFLGFRGSTVPEGRAFQGAGDPKYLGFRGFRTSGGNLRRQELAVSWSNFFGKRMKAKPTGVHPLHFLSARRLKFHLSTIGRIEGNRPFVATHKEIKRHIKILLSIIPCFLLFWRFLYKKISRDML